jgi:hypothetical protein
LSSCVTGSFSRRAPLIGLVSLFVCSFVLSVCLEIRISRTHHSTSTVYIYVLFLVAELQYKIILFWENVDMFSFIVTGT